MPPNEIGHSRGGASTKIHAVVDAYGYPVYFMISEGQRNDINYALPLLEHVNTTGSNVLADRGYDSNKLLDYVYDHGGEPTIPSRKGAKFDRHCDWWLYIARQSCGRYIPPCSGGSCQTVRRSAFHDAAPITFFPPAMLSREASGVWPPLVS